MEITAVVTAYYCPLALTHCTCVSEVLPRGATRRDASWYDSSGTSFPQSISPDEPQPDPEDAAPAAVLAGFGAGVTA